MKDEISKEQLAEDWYELRGRINDAKEEHKRHYAERFRRLEIMEKERLDLEEQLQLVVDDIEEAEDHLQEKYYEGFDVGQEAELEAIEEKILQSFDPEDGYSFETEHVKVKFSKSSKVIIDDKTGVAEALVRNNQAEEGIRSFSKTKVRSFIDAGVITEAAHIEEIIRPKIEVKKEEGG